MTESKEEVEILKQQLEIFKTVLGQAEYDRILQIPVKNRIQNIKSALGDSLPMSKYLIDNIYDYMQFQSIPISVGILSSLQDLDFSCKTVLTVQPNTTILDYNEGEQTIGFYLFNKDTLPQSYFEYHYFKMLHSKLEDNYFNAVIRDDVTGFFILVDVLERYDYGTFHPVKHFYCYTSMEELLQVHENSKIGENDTFGIKFREMHHL